jgi:hypothetical protein
VTEDRASSFADWTTETVRGEGDPQHCRWKWPSSLISVLRYSRLSSSGTEGSAAEDPMASRSSGTGFAEHRMVFDSWGWAWSMVWRKLLVAACCFIIVTSYVLWDERLQCYDGCLVPVFKKFPRRQRFFDQPSGQCPRGETLEHFHGLLC